MKYDKNQFRDFFNQMTIELSGDDDESLRQLREKHGIAMLPPTEDEAKRAGRRQLLLHLQRLTPFIKSVLDQLE